MTNDQQTRVDLSDDEDEDFVPESLRDFLSEAKATLDFTQMNLKAQFSTPSPTKRGDESFLFGSAQTARSDLAPIMIEDAEDRRLKDEMMSRFISRQEDGKISNIRPSDQQQYELSFYEGEPEGEHEHEHDDQIDLDTFASPEPSLNPTSNIMDETQEISLLVSPSREISSKSIQSAHTATTTSTTRTTTTAMRLPQARIEEEPVERERQLKEQEAERTERERQLAAYRAKKKQTSSPPSKPQRPEGTPASDTPSKPTDLDTARSPRVTMVVKSFEQKITKPFEAKGPSDTYVFPGVKDTVEEKEREFSERQKLQEETISERQKLHEEAMSERERLLLEYRQKKETTVNTKKGSPPGNKTSRFLSRTFGMASTQSPQVGTSEESKGFQTPEDGTQGDQPEPLSERQKELLILKAKMEAVEEMVSPQRDLGAELIAEDQHIEVTGKDEVFDQEKHSQEYKAQRTSEANEATTSKQPAPKSKPQRPVPSYMSPTASASTKYAVRSTEYRQSPSARVRSVEKPKTIETTAVVVEETKTKTSKPQRSVPSYMSPTQSASSKSANSREGSTSKTSSTKNVSMSAKSTPSTARSTPSKTPNAHVSVDNDFSSRKTAPAPESPRTPVHNLTPPKVATPKTPPFPESAERVSDHEFLPGRSTVTAQRSVVHQITTRVSSGSTRKTSAKTGSVETKKVVSAESLLVATQRGVSKSANGGISSVRSKERTTKSRSKSTFMQGTGSLSVRAKVASPPPTQATRDTKKVSGRMYGAEKALEQKSGLSDRKRKLLDQKKRKEEEIEKKRRIIREGRMKQESANQQLKMTEGKKFTEITQARQKLAEEKKQREIDLERLKKAEERKQREMVLKRLKMAEEKKNATTVGKQDHQVQGVEMNDMVIGDGEQGNHGGDKRLSAAALLAVEKTMTTANVYAGSSRGNSAPSVHSKSKTRVSSHPRSRVTIPIGPKLSTTSKYGSRHAPSLQDSPKVRNGIMNIPS